METGASFLCIFSSLCHLPWLSASSCCSNYPCAFRPSLRQCSGVPCQNWTDLSISNSRQVPRVFCFTQVCFFYAKTWFNPDNRAKWTSTIMSGLQAMVAAQAWLSLLRREIFFPPLLNLIIFPRKLHAVKTTHRSLHLLKAAFKADSFNWQQEAGSWKHQNTHISHCPKSPIFVSSRKAESKLWKPDLKKLRQSHYYWLVTPSGFSCTKMQSFTWTLIRSV